MTKNLKVGDRVKVRAYPYIHTGEVAQVYTTADNVVNVRLSLLCAAQSGCEYIDVFAEQCRRLRARTPYAREQAAKYHAYFKKEEK